MKFLLTAIDRFDMVSEAIREFGNEVPIIIENNRLVPKGLSATGIFEPSNQKYLKQARDIIESLEVDCVLSTSGYDEHVLTEGLIGEICEEKSILFIGQNTECISICNNKHKTREVLKSHNLIAEGELIKKRNDLEDYFKKNNATVIYKPTSEMSGNGQIVIDNITQIKSLDLQLPGIVERFIEGIEVGLDIFTLNNKHISFEPIYKSETSLRNKHSLEKVRIANFPFSAEVKNRIIEAGRIVAEAVKSSGWINIDLILDKNENIYIIDVNPRTGGTTRMNYMASKVNPYKIAIEQVLNHKKMKNLVIPFSDCVLEFPIYKNFDIENSDELFIYYSSNARTYLGILTVNMKLLEADRNIFEVVAKNNSSVVQYLEQLGILNVELR